MRGLSMESLSTVRFPIHDLWIEANICVEDKLDIEELEKHMPKKTGRPEHRSNLPQTSGKQGDTELSECTNAIADTCAYKRQVWMIWTMTRISQTKKQIPPTDK